MLGNAHEDDLASIIPPSTEHAMPLVAEETGSVALAGGLATGADR